MDWFERITGFAEGDGTDVRARLRVDGDAIVNIVNGRRFGMGTLEIVSLAELRERARRAVHVPPVPGAHRGDLQVHALGVGEGRRGGGLRRVERLVPGGHAPCSPGRGLVASDSGVAPFTGPRAALDGAEASPP